LTATGSEEENIHPTRGSQKTFSGNAVVGYKTKTANSFQKIMLV